MTNDHFKYNFVDNYTRKTYEACVPSKHFHKVSVGCLIKSGIDYGEQIPLQCYDNVSRTLIKNFGRKPELRFCIGLLQSRSNPEEIVEHCWTERHGMYFDAIEDREDSIYWLYKKALSMSEIVDIGRKTERACLPNITTLLSMEKTTSAA